MKKGSLIGGIILLIIGVSLYGLLQTNASDCASFMGQLGRTMSSEISQRCQTVALIQVFGLILVVIGLGLLIYGAVAKSKGGKSYSAKDEEIDFSPQPTKEETQEEKNIRNLGILKERLARGEITKEEYDELKKVFESK